MTTLNKTTSRSVEEISESRTTNTPSRQQTIRHSLPVKSSLKGSSSVRSLRHANAEVKQSAHRPKISKAPLPPSIPEDKPAELDPTVIITIDDDGPKRSRTSYDNYALQLDERRSQSSSINTSARSSRNPSINTVIREQYCCCSKWTQCERVLFATIGVLVFIIIILAIVVGVVAGTKGESPAKVLGLT